MRGGSPYRITPALTNPVTLSPFFVNYVRRLHRHRLRRPYDNMALSVDELRSTVTGMRKAGLSTVQISDEMSFSQDTVMWL